MVFFVLFFFLLEYKVRTSLFLCAKKKNIFPRVCLPLAAEKTTVCVVSIDRGTTLRADSIQQQHRT